MIWMIIFCQSVICFLQISFTSILIDFKNLIVVFLGVVFGWGKEKPFVGVEEERASPIDQNFSEHNYNNKFSVRETEDKKYSALLEQLELI